MMTVKKDSVNYGVYEIDYSINLDNGKYSGRAWIIKESGSHIDRKEIYTDKVYDTLKEAEKAIIEGCKKEVDRGLFN